MNEAELAARDAANVAKGLEMAAGIAEIYRDGASEWHQDAANNPRGEGYCCLKTAANIVGGIRAMIEVKP